MGYIQEWLSPVTKAWICPVFKCSGIL